MLRLFRPHLLGVTALGVLSTPMALASSTQAEIETLEQEIQELRDQYTQYKRALEELAASAAREEEEAARAAKAIEEARKEESRKKAKPAPVHQEIAYGELVSDVGVGHGKGRAAVTGDPALTPR